MWEVRQKDRYQKAPDHQHVPPGERVVAQVQQVHSVARQVGDVELHVLSA